MDDYSERIEVRTKCDGIFDCLRNNFRRTTKFFLPWEKEDLQLFTKRDAYQRIKMSLSRW